MSIIPLSAFFLQKTPQQQYNREKSSQTSVAEIYTNDLVFSVSKLARQINCESVSSTKWSVHTSKINENMCINNLCVGFCVVSGENMIDI